MPYEKDMEKFLITGATGQLGHALQLKLGGDDGNAMPRSREALDITNTEMIEEWLPTVRPDAVINCAAYTNVPKAEEDVEQCWRVNALGVATLARVCAEHDIPFFHISTDFVFGQDFARCMRRGETDVTFEEPLNMDQVRREMTYTENCPVGPCGHYAQSKVAGEHAILSLATENPDFNYWIIRTAGLFEKPWRKTNNFLYQIASRLTNTGSLPVVSDVFTNICYAEHLVKAIKWMVDNREEWTTDEGPLCPKGTYHIANDGACSWYEIANRLAAKLGSTALVTPTTRAAYAASQNKDPKRAPSYTCLDMAKYEETEGPKMPHWHKAVDAWAKVAADHFK